MYVRDKVFTSSLGPRSYIRAHGIKGNTIDRFYKGEFSLRSTIRVHLCSLKERGNGFFSIKNKLEFTHHTHTHTRMHPPYLYIYIYIYIYIKL